MDTRRLFVSIVFYFSCVSIISTPDNCEGASLYAILVADTKDDDIGEDCSDDLEKMHALTEKIALHTGLSLVQVHITGRKLTPEKLLKTVDNLEVEPDDVVIYYYTGHGYRTRSMGSTPPWPIYEFFETSQGVESEYVMEKLESKNPRFLLAINDCCNVFLKKNEEEPLLVRDLRRIDPHILAQNYSLLFLDTSGVIKISSATPGEYSYTVEEVGDYGGKYTNAFVKSFYKVVSSSKKANWDSLLKNASKNLKDKDQHPVWETNIK